MALWCFLGVLMMFRDSFHDKKVMEGPSDENFPLNHGGSLLITLLVQNLRKHVSQRYEWCYVYPTAF